MCLYIDNGRGANINDDLYKSVCNISVCNGRVESHFLTIEKLEHGCTAKALFDKVCEILARKGLPRDKLIALGTDGASVMTGKNSGVVTRFKN